MKELHKYFIGCLIVSYGAAFIHIGYNSPPRWGEFFMWLPLTWVLLGVFALMIGLIMKIKNYIFINYVCSNAYIKDGRPTSTY